MTSSLHTFVLSLEYCIQAWSSYLVKDIESL